MRIGELALKHGVTIEDTRHATRNAVRRITMDDDLTMLIGPAQDGALLKMGVLDLDGEMPWPSTPCRCGQASVGFSPEP